MIVSEPSFSEASLCTTEAACFARWPPQFQVYNEWQVAKLVLLLKIDAV